LNEIFNQYSKDLSKSQDMIFNHMLFLYLYFRKARFKIVMLQVRFLNVSHLIKKNLDLKVQFIFKAHLIDQNWFQKGLDFLKYFLQASCFMKKLC